MVKFGRRVVVAVLFVTVWVLSIGVEMESRELLQLLHLEASRRSIQDSIPYAEAVRLVLTLGVMALAAGVPIELRKSLMLAVKRWYAVVPAPDVD
jgi:hypothetical protein